MISDNTSSRSSQIDETAVILVKCENGMNMALPLKTTNESDTSIDMDSGDRKEGILKKSIPTKQTRRWFFTFNVLCTVLLTSLFIYYFIVS